ncbi:unnamed protein product [Polarella glacialis]|uniref:Uncharacterized protein n=1 Tax=Polarella glacialis TaxID=89957 RepID=A0A813HLD7_POLGL|nr:unnamed protein product [Polarella glacialis]
MAHVDSPFERAFAALPQHIFRSLLSHGYIGIQGDGELLKLMLDADDDKSVITELVNSAIALLPDDSSGFASQEVTSCLVKLARYAAAGKQTCAYTELECAWVTPQRRKLLEQGASGPESAVVLSAVSKWRHWSPRMITDMEPVTQQELERRLRLKWFQRIVDHLVPHWEHIPNMQSVRYRTDYNREYIHLFGAARWGSLRRHCLNLENMIKLASGFIPWTKAKVIDFLNCSENKNWTPSQYLSGNLGMLDPDTVSSLHKKKEAVCDNLVTALILPQHRAEVPALELIMLMETGCTKTVSVNPREVVPLIAPLHSFIGIPWWETIERFVKLFSSNNNFSNMDYLLLMIAKDRTGFIPRPMTNATGLRWIRTVLIKLGAPNAQVEKLTWPSFRVFFTDWAFQAGISRDRRRYIGRWANEITADTYTREHRAVVCSIWKEVAPQTDKIRAGRPAPEDLNRKDYELEAQAGAAGVSDPEVAPKLVVAWKQRGTFASTQGTSGPASPEALLTNPVNESLQNLLQVLHLPDRVDIQSVTRSREL